MNEARRRTCMDCLRAFWRKHREAKKPWPDWVHHYTGNRYCLRHAALRAEYSTRAAGKRAKRVVAWADRTSITDVYKQAAKQRARGEVVHVDHVIPLCGKYVSGLHVGANLAVIPAKENIRKGNRFMPG